MIESIAQFHFLRPLWLLMLLPCGALIVYFWRAQQNRGSWSKVIAPALLPWLLPDGGQQRSERWPLLLLLSGWLIACLALAGPSWQKLPVPVSKNQQPLVVVVDLSYLTYASDLSPNRLTRVRFKLQDLFNQRRDGLTALVAYAGSAHTVAPLTDDSRTLNNLIQALSPEIMPLQEISPTAAGPVAAVRQAQQLITQGGSKSGEILLVTGFISTTQAEQITSQLKGSDIRLSVLGTGTEQGAPIPLPDGGYLKDSQGTIVVPQLERARLQELARANGGQYQTMTIGDQDLQALLPALAGTEPVEHSREQEYDQWYDAGYWLVWLLLPMALFGFRRGWLLALVITVLPLAPQAQAFSWNDLWQTRNQQGQRALQAGDAAAAATLFENPEWRAQALFDNEQFEQSAAALDGATSANSAYNQGNALARAGKLEEALEAYQQALARQPDMADAQYNRDLVEQLLKQQQSQQSQQEQQSGQNQQPQQDQQSGQNQQSQQDQQSGQNQQSQQDQQSGQNQQSRQDQQSGQNQQSQQNQQSSEDQSKQANQQPAEQQGEQPAGDDQGSQEQQNARARQSEDETEQQGKAGAQETEPLSGKQQAIDSWLRTIPDDPGGLLRRKFLQQQRAVQQQKINEGASW